MASWLTSNMLPGVPQGELISTLLPAQNTKQPAAVQTPGSPAAASSPTAPAPALKSPFSPSIVAFLQAPLISRWQKNVCNPTIYFRNLLHDNAGPQRRLPACSIQRTALPWGQGWQRSWHCSTRDAKICLSGVAVGVNIPQIPRKGQAHASRCPAMIILKTLMLGQLGLLFSLNDLLQLNKKREIQQRKDLGFLMGCQCFVTVEILYTSPSAVQMVCLTRCHLPSLTQITPHAFSPRWPEPQNQKLYLPS